MNGPVREKFKKILARERERSFLSPEQLMLISWALKDNDQKLSLDFAELAADHWLDTERRPHW